MFVPIKGFTSRGLLRSALGRPRLRAWLYTRLLITHGFALIGSRCLRLREPERLAWAQALSMCPPVRGNLA